MTTRWIVLLPVALALCGCSSSWQIWVTRPHPSLAAWDSLGRDPTLPPIKRARTKPEKPKSENKNKETEPAIESREAELARLLPYSREWVALRGAIDAEEDARIAMILIICRGCEGLISPTKAEQQVTNSSEAP
jgi:hypothetical protein